jgi:hypothetical protein
MFQPPSTLGKESPMTVSNLMTVAWWAVELCGAYSERDYEKKHLIPQHHCLETITINSKL